MNSLPLVRNFHKKYNCAINNKPVEFNTQENLDLYWLRIALIDEELNELSDAVQRKDKTKVLDALCDLEYVVNGAFIALGYASVKEKAMNEVHRSNMTKDGVKTEMGKITKGNNYIPPNLGQFI